MPKFNITVECDCSKDWLLIELSNTLEAERVSCLAKKQTDDKKVRDYHIYKLERLEQILDSIVVSLVS